MADHEMLNLEEMGNLKDSMELLGEELMNGHRINPNLYVEYDVKRGLRDSAGKGVLTGLTEISDVTGYDLINGRKIPAHGRLYYHEKAEKSLMKFGEEGVKRFQQWERMFE